LRLELPLFLLSLHPVPNVSREVRPSQKPGHVLNERASLEPVPAGWSLLPPGDAALSRRLKADGPSWTMIELKGRKRFSHGIWAPADRIAALRAELETERADPAYVEDFRAAVLTFLAFHPRYTSDAQLLADLIAAHATPVGSGTVARTERIPIEDRAEAATIAWLRHQTTGYDQMRIPLVKGRRREVRRLLAQRSHDLLRHYRSGQPPASAHCPLQAALLRARPPSPTPAPVPTQGVLF
jgi:hypothetical protein